MYNYLINFLKVINENLPVQLRAPIRLSRLQVWAKPFKVMYGEFLAKKADLDYRCNFSGQKIYLETALNDRFDPINRGITITDAFYDEVFIYKKSESRPPLILYRKWNSTTTWPIGSFCVYSGHVYTANTANTNKVPGTDPQWTLTARKVPILRMKENYNGSTAFYVNVPSSVTFNQAEMTSLIKYYKLAGPGFQIKIV